MLIGNQIVFRPLPWSFSLQSILPTHRPFVHSWCVLHTEQISGDGFPQVLFAKLTEMQDGPVAEQERPYVWPHCSLTVDWTMECCMRLATRYSMRTSSIVLWRLPVVFTVPFQNCLSNLHSYIYVRTCVYAYDLYVVFFKKFPKLNVIRHDGNWGSEE